MRPRRLVLLIALYVTLDFTNPFIGSAFTFNADQSVEGLWRQHDRLLDQATPAALPADPGPVADRLLRPAVLPRPRVRALEDWLVQLRQAHAPLSDPQSSSEDH